ncbi:MAG: site-specific DNA-methyltransferase [Patescibacteria group bacterium]|nr:site-specific DNA-methyltransferase [Patescibacteria group bacterium]
MNRLYYGDNLTIMQRMGKHSVDLIYMDPPFNSKQNYNLMYKTLTGKPVPEQVEAFCDTWEMDAEKERIARSMPVLMREHGVEDYYVDFWRLWMNALRHTQPHLLAYLIYMVQRLLHMKSILRPTGSIYLHCDPTASHYIKVMMDGIFGHQNFRNEIIWRRTGAHNKSGHWGPVHDVILFYTASNAFVWNNPRQPYMQGHVDEHFEKDGAGYRTAYYGNVLTGSGLRGGESGKPWKGIDPSAKGRHWAVPGKLWEDSGLDATGMGQHQKLDALYDAGMITITPGQAWPMYSRRIRPGEGPATGDVWAYQPYTEGTVYGSSEGIDADVSWIKPQSNERLGYPTQKPVGLLKRIILASSNPKDIVFDPFCGCGTTIYAAHETEREWIGCDIAILAIKLIKETLLERYRLVEGHNFEIDGIPVSVEQAQTLFEHDPFQFQHWFVERVGGFPMTKKVADRGIDGRLYFEEKGALKEVVISVKGGKIRPTDVRDLRGVLEREPEAEIAGFLSLHEPTKAMVAEAAEAGTYEYNGVHYPRLQLLTVEQVLVEKKELLTPSKVGSKIWTGQGHLPL